MTDRSLVNPPLIWIGALLALFGAIVLAVVLVRGRAEPVESAPAIQQEAQTTPPSRIWPVVAGLSLALGAGCIGLGMNRWRAAN
jgi:hypothetical protein